jgi:penicillin-insensitive murein endopeptidase
MTSIRSLALTLTLLVAGPAFAQDKGTVDQKPLPPIANPGDPKLAAKELFGRRATPADLRSRSIGSYARGCVAGAAPIPIDGENWQVMRLSATATGGIRR